MIEPTKELIEAYKKFIGDYKNKTEREMRLEIEGYSDRQGWGWDGWKDKVKVSKKE